MFSTFVCVSVVVCLASSSALWWPLLGYDTRSDISEIVCFLEGCGMSYSSCGKVSSWPGGIHASL